MNEKQSRQPAGRPIGGQFAPTEHREAKVSLAASGSDADRTAWAEGLGLPGSFAEYTGSDPNVEQPALTYTTPGGREVHLCDIGRPSMSAFWDGRGDDDAIMRTEPAPESGDAGIRDAILDVAQYAAVRDAMAETSGLPKHGDEFELRWLDLREGSVGLEYRAAPEVDDDDGADSDDEDWGDGDEVSISYSPASDELTLVFDDRVLEPGSEEYTGQLTRLLDDGWVAPVDASTAAEKTKAAFRGLIAAAGSDPDAPEWMKAAHKGA